MSHENTAIRWLCVAVLLLCPWPVMADTARAAHAVNLGNYVAAFDELEPLAKAGDPAAQRWLAGLYFFGKGVPRDIQKGIALYRLSAENGDPWAMARLGRLYYDGKHLPQDYAEAYRWTMLAMQRDEIAGGGSTKYVRNGLASKMQPEERRRINREILVRHPWPTWRNPDAR